MAAPSGYIGRLGEFQQSRETFSAYVERLELFFAANNIVEIDATDEESVRKNCEIQTKMRAIFLTEVGPAVYETVKNLLAPGKPKDTSLQVILNKLRDHFDPKPLEIAESYRFGTRCQLPEEDIANFVVALKKLSIHCNFGDFQDRALRDRFVCGLRSERIRSKLMTMSNLTFDVACSTAIQMDLAEKGSKAVRPSASAQHQSSGEVHKMYHPAQKTNKAKSPKSSTGTSNHGNRTGKPCYRCSGQHSPMNCPFKNAECYSCKKKGHIASACRNKNKPTSKQTRSSGSTSGHRQSLHTLEQEPTTEEDELAIYTIYSNSTATGKPARAQNGSFSVCVELGGAPVTMEIDTGASVSVIPEAVYMEKLKQIPLDAKRIELRSYSGEKIPVLGSVQVPVTYKGQQADLPLVVVKGDKPALLGRNWLQTLKLNWSDIFHVRVNFKCAEDVIKQHPKVFSAQGEQITGHNAKVRVKPDARPVHSPGIFQGVMTEILEGIEGVVCYLDDILVSAPDKSTHDEKLLEVLKRLEKHNVRVKPQKCEFFKDSVEYLGHRVDKDGLHPMKCKVDAIKNAPTPRNISELRSFLGLVQYYGKFMQNLATILHPLNELLKNDVPWRWTHELPVTADDIRKATQTDKVLSKFDIVPRDYDGYFESATRDHIPVIGARSLLKPQDRLILECLINPSNEAADLPADTCLGQFFSLTGNKEEEYEIMNVTADTETELRDKSLTASVLPSKLSKSEYEKAEQLLQAYSDIFRATSHDIGQTDLIHHHINTSTETPIRQRAYRTSPAMRVANKPDFEKRLEEMGKMMEMMKAAMDK
ncbi:uncharacterized protein [Diadema antillarum]|uniref:uncharacterized protein n=1 Tax=Diadema antillarum TaxID=105358 RepID=UPI003A83A0D3